MAKRLDHISVSVSRTAIEAKPVTLMLYDRLFTIENVNAIPEDKTYNDYLNPNSLTVVSNALVESAALNADAEDKFQFVRDGYYCKDSKRENTFNRIVGLKDSFPAKK